MVPKLVAHRGFMQDYPENSLPGIEAALNAGACMVEFDVQMCADKQLVVLHDNGLNRTAGINRNVFDLSLQELSGISVHEPLRLGGKYSNIMVPTLVQAMELVKQFPDVTAFVEIKDESLEHWGLEFVMQTLLKQLQPYAQQSVIISYNFNALKHAKQHSQFATGWVLKDFDLVHYQLADQLEPEYLICNHTKIPDDREPWKGPWSWMLYDISMPELALYWASRGVSLIETGDIGAMLQDKTLHEMACG